MPTTTQPYSGRLVVFSVETSTPGTFVPVLSAKSNSYTINHTVVDTTTKADVGWGSILSGGGITSFEVSLSGIFINADYDKKLRGYAFTGEKFAGKLVTGNGDAYTGSYIITSMDVSGEFDGSETYSIKLQNAGEITFTAAP